MSLYRAINTVSGTGTSTNSSTRCSLRDYVLSDLGHVENLLDRSMSFKTPAGWSTVCGTGSSPRSPWSAERHVPCLLSRPLHPLSALVEGRRQFHSHRELLMMSEGWSCRFAAPTRSAAMASIRWRHNTSVDTGVPPFECSCSWWWWWF